MSSMNINENRNNKTPKKRKSNKFNNNEITTKAIIETNPYNNHKRKLENESGNENNNKKLCTESNGPIVENNEIIFIDDNIFIDTQKEIEPSVNQEKGTFVVLSTNQTKSNIDYDNVIINETEVLNSPNTSRYINNEEGRANKNDNNVQRRIDNINTVFQKEFKNKLNNLTKEYSNLIGHVKIEKDDVIIIDDDNTKNQKINKCDKFEKIDGQLIKSNTENKLITLNKDIAVNDDEICVLGPAPPKQFDIITLDEDGDELKSDANVTGESNNAAEKSQTNVISIEEDKVDPVEKKKKEPNGIVNEQPDVNGEIGSEKEEEEVETFCPYPKMWNKEMINYYTESVNVQHFKDRIKRQVMRAPPHTWNMPYKRTFFRFNEQYDKLCENCGMRSHDIKSCPKPSYSTCPMCGVTGHLPDRCPDSQCLNCGKRTDDYLFNCEECDQKVVLKIKCEACNKLYHTSNLCPHLWRILEFTTKKGKIKLVPLNKQCTNSKYCSNCGEAGHLIQECSHLSADHPFRQDNPIKILTDAYVNHLVEYKFRVNQQIMTALMSTAGTNMLQKVSNESGISIEFLIDEGVNIIAYKSNPVQSGYIRKQLREYLFNS